LMSSLIKFTTTTALVAVAMLTAFQRRFAGRTRNVCAMLEGEFKACVNAGALNLPPDQKTKIEEWQAECVKAGCTKDKPARRFLQQAERNSFCHSSL